MQKEHSIFKKLVYYTLPVAIIPFLLLLGFFYHYIRENLRAEELNHVKDKMNSYIQNIEVSKNTAILKTDYIIMNSNLKSLLEENKKELHNRMELLEQIENYVQAINGLSKVSITIYTDNPSILAGMYTEKLENLHTESVFESLKESSSNMYFEQKVHTNESEGNYLNFYRRLIGKYNTIICVKAYLPYSEEFTIVSKNSEHAYGEEYLTQAVTSELVATAKINHENLSRLYVRYGLIILMIALVFCVIIALATITITSKTTHKISTFIFSLANKDIPTEYEVSISEKTDNLEMKIIKKSLNRLISKVKESKDIQYKTEMEKNRLRLELLQSKIDPHILYNSLAAISHRIFKSGDKEMFRMIKNLTSYYRLVLAGGKEYVKISDEIDMLEKFVSINEISHKQDYNFTYQLDPELNDIMLLHLSLQPFVENAIVHGLSGKEDDCQLSLNCKKVNNFMVFEIFDNGYGMKQETLDKLNSSLKIKETSYGIENAYSRLRLFYGNACSINFESKFGEFTKVTIKIPILMEETK